MSVHRACSVTGQVSGNSSLVFTGPPVAGPGRMLVVGIAILDADPLRMNLASVLYGDRELPFLGDSSATAGVSGAYVRTLLYTMADPPVGTLPISITTAGSCDRITAFATVLDHVYACVPENVAVNTTGEETASGISAYLRTCNGNVLVIGIAGSSALDGDPAVPTAGNLVSEATAPGRTAISWSAPARSPLAISCAAFVPVTGLGTVTIAFDQDSPQQVFGVSRLALALLQSSLNPVKVRMEDATGNERITVQVAPALTAGREGFSISLRGDRCQVQASDPSGALYGLLELAEQIRLHGLDAVEPTTVEARLPFRAIKHNTPWSSYRNDFAQDQHYETMQDLTYWDSFLGMMADNRYNTLTIWTQHPFPYLIRPANFPKATPFTDEELSRWQHLYRNIFRMARERGMEVFLVNWNIFVSEAFRENYDPNAHIDSKGYFGDAYTTPQIEQYTRECVTQVLNEYPDLTGIGFTLGEYMGGMTPAQREQWAMKTIIAGMQAADRPVKLIYRMPLSAGLGSGGSTSTEVEVMTRASIESIDGIVTPIETETKFNWSHGYTSTRLIQAHGGGISTAFWDPAPKRYRMDWMIRNEDFFVLRWGQVEFVREHLKTNSQPYVGGYYIGSECYYPALNYVDLPVPDDNRTRFGFERQWLMYLLWGRLLYHPATSDQSFELAFDLRYGPGTGSRLLQAYGLASGYVEKFGSFLYSTWDFTAYAEGFLCGAMAGGIEKRASPFLSLAEMMGHKVLDSRYLSIKDYVEGIIHLIPVQEDKITPLQLADNLEQDALQALDCIEGLESRNPGLSNEIGDIQAWCCLGRYFADKLRAGVALEMYISARDPLQKEAAMGMIQAARDHWLNLVSVTKDRVKPTRLIHIADDFTWERYIGEVERDVDFVEMTP